MFQGSLQHNIQEKNLKHKPQGTKVSHHKSLDEELRPQTMLNKSVKQLKGIKAIFIKEINKCCLKVFEIYEGDLNGHQLHNDAKPILYAVAQKISCSGIIEIAVTAKLDEIEKEDVWFQRKADIFINENGNGTLIGKIQKGTGEIVINSDYVNNLKITDLCCCEYKVDDDNKNKGSLVHDFHYFNCSHPCDYYCKFPPNYDESKNTLLLAGVLFRFSCK